MRGEAELGSRTHGSCCFPQPEEKQKATQQFSKLLAAMKVMGISGDEQKAFWLILGAIYHLGAAGATKGNELGALNEGRFGTDGWEGFQIHCWHLAAKPWGRGWGAVSAEGQCPATLGALGHPVLSPWLGWSH